MGRETKDARESLIDELAMEQAKDDLRKIIKPYIIKASDLTKELNRAKTKTDKRKAAIRHFWDKLPLDKYDGSIKRKIELKFSDIAVMCRTTIKTVKRYIYDEGDFGNTSSSVF